MIEELNSEYMRLVFRAKHYADFCDDINYMIADSAANDVWALILVETAKKGYTNDNDNPMFYT